MSLSNFKGRSRLPWAETALRLAFNITDYRCQDPYVQVGACLLKKDGNSTVLGYNGPPPKVEIDWADRDGRRPKVIHAEENVLNRVLPNEGDTIAVTHLPCDKCIKTLAMKGIKTVYYCIELPVNYDNSLAKNMAAEFGVALHQIILDPPPISLDEMRKLYYNGLYGKTKQS